MLRFVDLSGAYWTEPLCGTPLCAFLWTSDDTFVKHYDSKCQTFSSIEDIRESINDPKLAERMIGLLPPGFFEPPEPELVEFNHHTVYVRESTQELLHWISCSVDPSVEVMKMALEIHKL